MILNSIYGNLKKRNTSRVGDEDLGVRRLSLKDNSITMFLIGIISAGCSFLAFVMESRIWLLFGVRFIVESAKSFARNLLAATYLVFQKNQGVTVIVQSSTNEPEEYLLR